MAHHPQRAERALLREWVEARAAFLLMNPSRSNPRCPREMLPSATAATMLEKDAPSESSEPRPKRCRRGRVRWTARAAGQNNSLRGSCTDHDNPDPQRVAVAALGREHLVLNGEVIAQHADDPADLGLVLVVVVDDDVANRAVQQQLEAKRIVDPLHEVPRLIGVLAGSAT